MDRYKRGFRDQRAGRDSAGGGAINPATLALTGWWRGDGVEYNGSPWPGTASAGSSSGNSLSEATNPPAVGATVNGFAPADFDGTNDKLGLSGTADTYAAGTKFYGWMLFNLDAVNTNNVQIYENDCLLTTQPSAYFALAVKSTGAIGIRFVGAASVTETTFTIGQWQMVQWAIGESTVKIIVNGGPWIVSADASPFGDLTGTMVIGTNYAGAHFLDGRVLDVGLSDTIISDTQFNGILSYARQRYALTL